MDYSEDPNIIFKALSGYYDLGLSEDRVARALRIDTEDVQLIVSVYERAGRPPRPVVKFPRSAVH